MKYGFCSILLYSLLCFNTNAQTCCSGGVPLSNNLGLPNDGKHSLAIGLSYDYNNLNTLNVGSEELDDDSRLRVTNSMLLNTTYSFTDRLSIESLFTWVNQIRTISQFGNENTTETSGIGDAVFLVKYAIPNVLGDDTLLNIGLGTKVPLGRSDLIDDRGIQLTADLQPGSGAWDGLLWTSVSKKLTYRPSAIVFGNLVYRFTGVNNSYLNNTSTYEFGNELQVNTGYSDQFSLGNSLFSGGVTLKYRESFADKVDGGDLPNTGGNWVFIRPELSFHHSPNFIINSKLEFPIHSNVVGTQLTPTVRATLGVTIKLTTKKETNNL